MSLANIVKANTKDGHTIIDFLTDVMHGHLKHFKPCHRLSAARMLLIYGHGDAEDYVTDNSPAHHFTRPATRRTLRIAGVNPELARLIKSQTNNGLLIIEFVIAVMEGRVKNARPHHRMEAARDLLERGFGKLPRATLPRPPKPFQPDTRRYGYPDGTPPGVILKDMIARAIGDHDDDDDPHPVTASLDPATHTIEEPDHTDARPSAASPDPATHTIEAPDHTDNTRPDAALPDLATHAIEDPDHTDDTDTTPTPTDTPEPTNTNTDTPEPANHDTDDPAPPPTKDTHPHNPANPRITKITVQTIPYDPNTFHY